MGNEKPKSEIPVWRTILPPYDFVTTSMKMFGGFLLIAALFPAALALFALVQPLIAWLNPEYSAIPIRFNEQIASPFVAFIKLGSASICFLVAGSSLIYPTLNSSFQNWLRELTKHTRFTETGQGG